MIDEQFVRNTLSVVGVIFLIGLWGLCELYIWLSRRKR